MRGLFLLLIYSIVSFGGAVAYGAIHDQRALDVDPAQATQPIAPKLEGLGNLHFKVTTASTQSQEFFDQGLRLTYAFNHSEALRAFKEAARLDPENAMAYWGWALVLGPNLNLPMMPYVVPQAYEAIQEAVRLKDRVSPKEQAFIEALALRYSEGPLENRTSFDKAYAEAMEKLVKQYPDDLDAATLYAAALMNLSPWNYWNLDGSAKKNTAKVLSTLQSVVDRNPRHAGALHYYIHAVEARHPKSAEKYADMLRGLMPGAGHLVHMPSHIYMRVGRFADSYEANSLAVAADKNYITQCRTQGLYPLGYYPHNIHFLTWSAMMQGRDAAALDAARNIVDEIPHELVADKNTWALYETFLSQPVFVMVRFGLWDKMLAEPQPEVDSKFMTGIWHYGRALAYLYGKEQLGPAKKELHALTVTREQMAELDHYIGFGTAGKLLTIAEEITRGEIAYAEGSTLEGFAHLERAVRLEDSLQYNEPPDWYFPVRHFLGAMLLDAGKADEAEVIYAADLRKNPGNGYSLFGLAESLRMQGKTDDADAVEERFTRSWRDSTHRLVSSRF